MPVLRPHRLYRRLEMLDASAKSGGVTSVSLRMVTAIAVRSVGGPLGLDTQGGAAQHNVQIEPRFLGRQLQLETAFSLAVPRVVLGLLRVHFFIAAPTAPILGALCIQCDVRTDVEWLIHQRTTLLAVLETLEMLER